MKESWSDCEGGGEDRGEVMIRSDPNYVGEIEPHIERGRGRASATDSKNCVQIATVTVVNQDMGITESPSNSKTWVYCILGQIILYQTGESSQLA